MFFFLRHYGKKNQFCIIFGKTVDLRRSARSRFLVDIFKFSGFEILAKLFDFFMHFHKNFMKSGGFRPVGLFGGFVEK